MTTGSLDIGNLLLEKNSTLWVLPSVFSCGILKFRFGSDFGIGA